MAPLPKHRVLVGKVAETATVLNSEDRNFFLSGVAHLQSHPILSYIVAIAKVLKKIHALL